MGVKCRRGYSIIRTLKGGASIVKLKAIHRKQLQMANIPVYEYNPKNNYFEYEDLVFIEYVTHSYSVDEVYLDLNWEVYIVNDIGDVDKLHKAQLYDTVELLKETK